MRIDAHCDLLFTQCVIHALVCGYFKNSVAAWNDFSKKGSNIGIWVINKNSIRNTYNKLKMNFLFVRKKYKISSTSYCGTINITLHQALKTLNKIRRIILELKEISSVMRIFKSNFSINYLREISIHFHKCFTQTSTSIFSNYLYREELAKCLFPFSQLCGHRWKMKSTRFMKGNKLIWKYSAAWIWYNWGGCNAECQSWSVREETS